ncbi:hypothetical protein LUZ63_011426 [Rhynchospora breviuscula]|uniref:Pentatricopeptide repeat-containing protein n=1 Tax=Rhynchospora breviuscula TaxID=2022672 RepID=A0A9Q0CJ17_9POAL|nr:hypothetical protein LUZ63_011426 [Rhynchospora breviuscula]
MLYSTSMPITNPNSLQFLFSNSISTSKHLLQFFSLSITSHLLQPSNLYLFNSLLNSLAKGPCPSLSFFLFSLIRKHRLMPDAYTITTTLKSISRCSFFKHGEQLHSLILKSGFESNTFALNSLIGLYFSCGLTGLAKRVFDAAPSGTCDIVSWNSMVSGYLDNNMFEDALLVFTKMVKGFVRIDEVSPINALIACAKLGFGEVGKRIHTLIVVNGLDLNYYLGSALVSMYAKCGFTEVAHVVFDRMPERNVVCWGALIAGYVQFGKYKEAMELFRQMQLARVTPDEATMASVISLCAQMGALNEGRYIHAYCDIHGLGNRLFVKNALIDMYSKCGDVKEAYSVFLELTTRDVFSWTSMISGLAMNGYCTEALHLFEQMEREGEVVPNEVTFLGVLSACSHGGFVQKGYFYFDRMCKRYNLRPKIEHFGCMVDLLGRAKLIREALEFIENMPVLPDKVIWRALIFACRSSRETKIAKYAADKIAELDSNSNCGVHVMLSNVYATSSLWADVRTIRGFMKNQNEHKVPGHSFIEINGVVHEFLAGDVSHGETESIYQALKDLVNCCYMKETFA